MTSSRFIPAAALLLTTITACDTEPRDEAGQDSGYVDLGGDDESDLSGVDEGENQAPQDDEEEELDVNDPEQTDTCGAQTFEVGVQPTNIMLVLDKSGSMSKNSWDHDRDGRTADVTRWASLYDVTENLLDRYQDTLNFGAAFFPTVVSNNDGSDYANACVVADSAEVPVAPQNASSILAAMPDRESTQKGATPATAGIINGVGHLEDLNDGLPSAMILITDGAANCADEDDLYGTYDDALPEAVKDAYERAGIPTYVVGIDISSDGAGVDVDPSESLHQVALNGGVPRVGDEAFYNVRDEVALQEALDKIATDVTCTITLEEAGPAASYTRITIAGQEFSNVESCDEDGWRYTDATNTQVQLCGDACEALTETGKIEAEFTCVPVG